MSTSHRAVAARSTPTVLLLVMLVGVFSPRASAEPPAPAPAPAPVPAFARWPADPSYFPLAVWVQSPRNAQRYHDLGINTYVALWDGPNDEALDQLDAAGMVVICEQSEKALQKYRDRKTIIGWMHGDEPDNAQSLGKGKGYGPPITPETVIEEYKRMKSADPDRPVLLNLGQGVAFDNYIGRGVRRNHPEDYAEYLKGADLASFDIYPATHDAPEVAGKLEFVGDGVARLRHWTQGRKPVWCCIGTTHISNPDKMPTPAQVRSEVWMGIANGATGIVYFCHEFKPKQMEAGLLAYPEIADAVKRINGEVHALAPVLNSPTLTEGAATVKSSDPQVPIALVSKRYEGATYVVAVSMRNAPTTASFTLPGLGAGEARVEVLTEYRTLPAAPAGEFADHFDGYAVHLYRVK